tara:strand:- start:576 stop:749 length:174 start_codon:yes stop_codon:yes gene_type:complete
MSEQKTIEHLKSVGYRVVRQTLWPTLARDNEDGTTTRLMVAPDGRQVDISITPTRTI